MIIDTTKTSRKIPYYFDSLLRTVICFFEIIEVVKRGTNLELHWFS